MVQHVLSDRYELRVLLGRGGMAEVWQGFDRRLGRSVAVKVLHRDAVADPSMPARFDREAHTVAALSHPNIVAVHDVGADDGVSYLVMELIQGGSLAQRLAGGPLRVAEAVRVATGVCAALEAAAAAGVVHRDVKPANILFTAAGQVKVCDFGIARVVGSGQAELTGSAQIVGTSSYMAPEQVTGDTVDARTDLYGLGCVLYAMLTGRPPFTGDSPFRIAWLHVQSVAPPVATLRPEVPADLATLVGALLAKSPADRPAGPGQVRATLEQLDLQPASLGAAVPATTGTEPVRAAAAVPTRTLPARTAPPGGPPRMRPGVLALCTAVLLAGVAAVFLVTRPDQSGLQAAPTVSPTTATATRSPAAPTAEGAPTTTPPGERDSEDEDQPRRGAGPPTSVTAVRAVIDEQVTAGNLDEKGARDLRKELDKVAEEAAGGDPGKVSKETADLLDELDDLRREGRLRANGYDAVRASISALSAAG